MRDRNQVDLDGQSGGEKQWGGEGCEINIVWEKNLLSTQVLRNNNDNYNDVNNQGIETQTTGTLSKKPGFLN